MDTLNLNIDPSGFGTDAWLYAQKNYDLLTRLDAATHAHNFFKFYSFGFEQACKYIIDPCTRYFVLNGEYLSVQLSNEERTYIMLLDL